MEFRYFVHHKVLVGYSRREVTNFYPALLDGKNELETMIQKIFLENVKHNFWVLGLCVCYKKSES
ncbi:hypothetical protein ACS0TY_018436 [Phlomoides rotata]